MMRAMSSFLFLLFGVLTYGQENVEKYNDLLYMTEGSILKIKLLEYNHDSLLIEMMNGKTLKLPRKRVKKVVMQHEKTNNSVVKPYTLRENKIYFRTQISLLTNHIHKGYSVSQSVGYRYKHKLEAGLGLGVDNYKALPGYDIFPVFGEMRYYMLKNNSSPFFGTRMGYGFARANEDHQIHASTGGFFINPSVGVRWGRGRINYDLFLALKLQKYQITSFQGDNIFERDYTFRRYELGVSMTF